jgi:hypothetical protein
MNVVFREIPSDRYQIPIGRLGEEGFPLGRQHPAIRQRAAGLAIGSDVSLRGNDANRLIVRQAAGAGHLISSAKCSQYGQQGKNPESLIPKPGLPRHPHAP